MEAMIDPQSEIYDKLSELTEYVVYEERPEVLVDIENTPVITYSLSENVPVYSLVGELNDQDIGVNVDIYAIDTIVAATAYIEVEQKMRELGYRLTFNATVPDPEGFAHKRLQFTY